MDLKTKNRTGIQRKVVDAYSETDTNSTEQSDTSTASSATSAYDDALAKVKRDQNYKSFYNTAIQQYALKESAHKYLNNELASQGLDSQGYGSSARVGINNQAINMYESNVKNYNDTEQSITEDAYNRFETKSAELDNQLVTFIQNDIDNGNYDAINQHMANYGYMTQNEDGSYSYTEKWDNLDEDRKAYIQSVIDMQNASSEEVKHGGNYNYHKDNPVVTYNSEGTYAGTTKGAFNQENENMENAMLTGEIPTDSFIVLKNKNNQYIYIYYSTDGKPYYVTPSQYEAYAKDNNSYYIEGKDKTINKGVYPQNKNSRQNQPYPTNNSPSAVPDEPTPSNNAPTSADTYYR